MTKSTTRGCFSVKNNEKQWTGRTLVRGLGAMQHTTAQHAAVACSLDIQRTKYPSSDSLCNSLTAGSGSDAFAQYGPPVSRHQFGIVVPPQFGGLVQSWVAPQLLVQLT